MGERERCEALGACRRSARPRSAESPPRLAERFECAALGRRARGHPARARRVQSRHCRLAAQQKPVARVVPTEERRHAKVVAGEQEIGAAVAIEVVGDDRGHRRELRLHRQWLKRERAVPVVRARPRSRKSYASRTLRLSEIRCAERCPRPGSRRTPRTTEIACQAPGWRGSAHRAARPDS